MKRILYILLLFPIIALSQSTSQNYIKTIIQRDSANTTNERVDVTYFDGLGRPVQQIQGKMSATGTDIITHIEYDGFGRQLKDYLPFASISNNLTFYPTAKDSTNAYYLNTANVNQITSNPYSEKFFEPSPLNRVLKQSAPGNAWLGNSDPYNNNDHTVKIGYQTNTQDNTVNDVKKFWANATWDSTYSLYAPQFLSESTYPAGQLYKTVTKDENWTSGTANTTEEFKNKEGQVVLKRTWNGSLPLNTYYVYDQYGNLTYVLPPKADGNPAYLGDLGYQYKYDKRNRLVEKKLPGKQWEFIIYDQLDRPVITGPAFSPFPDVPGQYGEYGWTRTIYDAFGRVAMTGWVGLTVTPAARANIQNTLVAMLAVRGSGTVGDMAVGYNPVGGLGGGLKILTVNYYDDYTWPGAPADFNPIEGQKIRSKAKGLLTGSWVRILDAQPNTMCEVSYTLYDNKSRPVRSRTSNYLGGYTQVDSLLDFDGSTLKTTTTHKRSSGTLPDITVEENFTYTPEDRLLTHTHKIDNLAAEPLSTNEYNKLGQLKIKRVGSFASLGGSGPLQKVDYKYNVRGWLTDINTINSLALIGDPVDLFSFKISYDDVTDETDGQLTPTPALYNGNISETYWLTNSDNNLRKYSYHYDSLNRLTAAYYQKPSQGQPYTGSYDEYMSYDNNGNISWLERHGGVDDPNVPLVIDNLSYGYPAMSNQLLNVNDSSTSPQGFNNGANATTEYTYDTNGNMLADLNKGIINIKYNHLNLPSEIKFGTTNKIVYLYDAAGRKIKKTVTEVISGTPTIVDVEYFDGGFQYKGGVLQFFPTAEGYVDNTVVSGVNNYNYVYQYKDHLGNVRVSYTATPPRGGGTVPTVIIKEENHYYPFGLKHLNYNIDYEEYQEIAGDIVLYPPLSTSNKLKNNYKYNGKELQDELGLNMYAMDARQYDPAIGRFTSIDPIVHHSQSTYAAFDNNPAFWADPSGAAAVYNWSGANKGKYTDNGEVVDFETAMASNGLNANGSEKSNNGNGTTTNSESSEIKPLDKSTLLKYYKENYCQTCTEGQLQRRAGLYFEQQFELFAKGVTPSKFNFRKGTKLYGPRNTVPDFIADFFREYKNGRAATRVQGAAAYEVKAMDGTLYLSSNTNQLMGHIDNLSSKFRFMSSYGSPALTLATTYDVDISPKVTLHAAEAGVRLNQVVSYYTMVNNQMIITFGPYVPLQQLQSIKD